MRDKILAAYQRALNSIDDITEYRVPRPQWLKVILDRLDLDLRKARGTEDPLPESVTIKQLFDKLYDADANKNMVGKIYLVVPNEETLND